MSNNFNRLAPFIREHIYRNAWDSLNEIQEEACRVIFDTDAHLLLSSGTASGKTEAALLPALTAIVNEPSSTIAILYIAPMKALINDQFYRLDELLKEAEIPVNCWHGDILQSKKNMVLREPSGVLQITPESLESMLINRNRDLVRLFGDLRFVIIDEIHAFMGSDRGIQVLCQLERLQKYIRTFPRRIGLSATLGDYTEAEKWLASNTKTPVITVYGKNTHQRIKLSVEHNIQPVLETDMSPFNDPAWLYLYDKSLGKRCIIFSNGRETADAVITNLRYISAINGQPDIYHVHHGSISGPLREAAETEMKESEGPIVTGATVTLEMGIDIGRLERVIQIGPPISITSLVQRLGRSGRRGNVPEMLFTDWGFAMDKNSPLPNRLPWRLLQIIAMLQQYLEERWMEPPRILKYPLNMLYQQIMSCVSASGEMSPQALAANILSMKSFNNISEDDFRDMILHLIELNHLQLTEERGLIIGLEGEKIVNNYKFYAVFTEEEAWVVMDGSKKIGTVEDPVAPAHYMSIAGRCWLVTGLDYEKKLIFVELTKRKIFLFWHGDRAIVHNRILKRMKQVLFEDIDYPYLQEDARECLRKARQTARDAELDKRSIVKLDGDTLCLFPWMGHISYYTFLKIVRKYMMQTENDDCCVKKIGGIRPYFITFKTYNNDAEIILEKIKSVINSGLTPEKITDEKDIRQLKKQFEYKEPKYDRFINSSLLRKQVNEDYIDIDFLKTEINNWFC
ncbi:MAG: ATP-dependent helicase [Firmicutes bacterium HGW-Firmicutes-21]|nr:MAG: ATP-dependent helicase [Firmicutes bacterium HGW-Firmicutes-21]